MSAAPRAAAVVLVTDGAPTACTSSVASVESVAADGHRGTPSISTYVVGLGTARALNPVALAGSGNVFQVFDAAVDPAGEVASALTKIESLVTCDYLLPTDIDVRLSTVEVHQGGVAERVGRVDDAKGCGRFGGYYFDDPARPRKITLCSQTCDPLRNAPAAGVTLIIGCW